MAIGPAHALAVCSLTCDLGLRVAPSTTPLTTRQRWRRRGRRRGLCRRLFEEQHLFEGHLGARLADGAVDGYEFAGGDPGPLLLVGLIAYIIGLCAKGTVYNRSRLSVKLYDAH